MFLMVEKGMRGGVSMIGNRYGKSNNKYMGKSFIKKRPFQIYTIFRCKQPLRLGNE